MKRSIRNFVEHEPLFETHNHQKCFCDYDWSDISFREFQGYAPADMQIADGVKAEGDNGEIKNFFRLWPMVRTTGYGRAVELGIKQMFDLELTQETVPEINKRLKEYVGKKSTKEVFKDLFKKANIIGSVNDVLPANDLSSHKKMNHENFLSLFRFAPRIDGVLTIDSKDTVSEIERILELSISSLDDIGKAMDKLVGTAVAQGHVSALKIGVAYLRFLDFDVVPKAKAEKCFSSLMSGKKENLKPLHDYLFHRFIECAEKFDLPVQIHTGFLAGIGRDIQQGKPHRLVDVFIKYPRVKFDIFHASWPDSEFIGAVGKQFQNVWLDMCWAWAMNPVQMERILDEWLSAVPCNKILAYGSDTTTPFAVPGYAKQARNGIAAVLEKKIKRGEYDMETAMFVARRIMHENANELF